MQVTFNPRAERGFSMFIVITAMFVTSMFVAAAFAVANNGLSLSVENQQRKSSYAVAEAGLGYYLKKLRENPDVWSQCANASAPNGTEKSPINQQWDGKGTDPRTWRKIPGVDAEYTIELLHTSKYTKCETGANQQDSLIDMSSGTFRIRITGRATTDRAAKRSVIVTFKREGFLKFVYFTDQENRDPQASETSSERTTQQSNCADKYRTARKGQGCVEIQFATADAINGPLHTNDENLLVCGSPTFGRERTKTGATAKTDVIEVSGAAPGHIANPSGSGCTDTSEIWSPTGQFSPNSKPLKLPQSNSALQAVAEAGGRVYAGKTIVHLKNTVMDVTNYSASGVATTTTDVTWPNNGVLYVKNNGACNGEIPTDADYDEPFSCGNVYVSGAYSKPLTIAAANDVVVRPTKNGKLNSGSNDSNIILNDASDATLGLIANNFVRVGHKVVRSSGGGCSGNFSSAGEPTITNVRIDAAIMSLLHSFIVDNYNCGKSGTLTVNGAIVQKYRGPVGTGSGAQISTGYLKDYWYDDRLRFRSPPYFLDPLEAEWEVLGSQEQVPAR
jgi:hypothetical protein